MDNIDDVFFQFTANAVPHASQVKSNEDVNLSKFTQFTPEELSNLNLQRVDINLEHNLDEDGEPLDEDTTVGYIVRTMKSDKRSAFVTGELPPVPAEERTTPAGQKRMQKRREMIYGIANKTLKDVSVAHKNEYTLVDDSGAVVSDEAPKGKDVRIMVEKCVHEVSLTKEGGRPGSSIVDFGFSNQSLLPPGDTVEPHARPVCKSYVVIPGGDMESIPQYIRANLKNFNISVDKGMGAAAPAIATDPAKDNNSQMASNATIPAPVPAQVAAPPGTQAAPAAAAPAPTQVIQAPPPAPPGNTLPPAAPLPVIPGSEASSAYLQTINSQQTKINQQNAELEELRKAKEKLQKYEEKESQALRTDLVNHNKRFNDDVIMALEADEELKANPEEQKYIAQLKQDAEAAQKVFNEKLVVKMDEATSQPSQIVLDPQDMITYMKNNVQMVHAYSKIGAKRRQLDLHQRQMEEIERAKAAATLPQRAAQPFTGSVAATPQAAAAPPGNTAAAAPPGSAPVNNLKPVFDKADFIASFRSGLKRELPGK
jgi:hypothetical protein